ncbi:MAG: alpha/beta hydrolase [Eubacteriales bacterium]|nr:alpha/beta hydrolase [Eubacteriales bacterium]MDD3882878.1 alpha/beta hydrolase [Eubacteriales bacterium]
MAVFGIICAVFAVLFLLFLLVVRRMFAVAFGRYQEGHKVKSAMPSTLPASAAEEYRKINDRIAEASAEMLEREHEKLEITGIDGARLTALWFPAKNQKRVLLCAHGYRGTKLRDFSLAFKFLVALGCSVLTIDERAHGESGGNYTTFGALERYDIALWARFLDEKTGGKTPIYLMGISMGASAVLLASGLSLPRSVRGVIADCGFTVGYEECSYVVKKVMKLPGLVMPLCNYFCRALGGFDLRAADVRNALRLTDVPVLMFHGESDSFVPCEMGRENYAACRSEKRLITVKGADHTMSYVKAREEYERAVEDFFLRHDNAEDI